jgi:uncharacterized membrane protein YdjX (TVP38/TMEM64 family)
MNKTFLKKYNHASLWRLLFLIIFVAAIIIAHHFLNLGAKLENLRTFITNQGSLGSIIFLLLYIGAVIAAVPGTAITIAGAALFGSVQGIILVSIGATIGASIAFLLARYLGREFILRKLSRNDTFIRLDQATKEHGAIIVAIVRLIPLFPFNIVNYGFGLTSVPFWKYVFWSWLCMLPATVLYVVGTDAIIKWFSEGKIPWYLLLAFAAAGIILAILVYLARKKLASGKAKQKQS